MSYKNKDSYKTISEVVEILNKNNLKNEWRFLAKLLSQKNAARKQCILLPFNALNKIVSKI